MRKVNIMVDVSDDVYETVVAPFKKARQFSELINSLLTGYLKDDYVAAYVDGTLDILRQESSKSFDEALKAMNDSFATVSMLADEATNMMNEGIEAVKVGKGKSRAVDNDEDEEIAVAVEEPQREEGKVLTPSAKDDNLRKEVDDLKRQNQEMNENIQMLLKMFKNGVMVSPQKEEDNSDLEVSSHEEEKEESKDTLFTSESNESESMDESDPLFGDVDFGEEETPLFDDDTDDGYDEDDDFLTNLLQGQVMSV